MTYKIRKGALSGPASEKEQSVTAPWVLDLNGQPLPLPVKPGEIAVYDPDASIVHVRNERRGTSRTLTPTVDVYIDHEDCLFDVQFRDPADGLRLMPSIAIDEHGVVFHADDGKNGYTFSNRAMFETFCDFMDSPIYNPFEAPIPAGTSGLRGDVQKRELFYRTAESDEFDDDDDDDDDDAYPIEGAYCRIVSFAVEIDRPVAVWDRFENENVQLGPGRYEGKVERSNRETGEPIRVKLEGRSKAGVWMSAAHLDWAALERELTLEHARVVSLVERVPFDPAPYRPISPEELAVAKAAAPPLRPPKMPFPKPLPAATTKAKGSLFGLARKLLGK